MIPVLFDFNLPLWVALSLSVGVTALVARFCYSRLASQDRLLKIVVTAIRAITTLALLFLALDATIIRTQTSGSRVCIIGHPSRSRSVERLVQDARLNARFQIEMFPETPSEVDTLKDSAAIVIASQSADQAIDVVELIEKRSVAPIFVTLENLSPSTPGIGITSIGADGTAMLGASTNIQVALHGRGMAGKTTKVELGDEFRVLGSATVNWKGEDESVIAQLSFTPVIEGMNRFSVKAGTEGGEAAAENDEMKFSLDVRRIERRILFIENQPTWEGKFIRRALEEGGLFKLDYFAQISREAGVTHTGTGVSQDLRKILADFDLLARYDAIIAGPTESTFFSVREARNIDDFIERRGGGLVILGSNDFSGSIVSVSSPLAHLSPANVSLGSAADGAATFLVPTEEGLAEGLFQSQAPGTAFDRLGPISTAYLKIGSLKPGATALAKDGSVTGAEAPVLVASQYYGHGRIILVSPSDLWRAMLAEADERQNPFVAFWQNLALRATAKAEPPSHIRLANPVISAGQRVTAYLTARDKAFNSLTAIEIETEAAFHSQADEGSVALFPVTLEQEVGAPGVYKLSFPVRQEGRGEIKASIQSPGIGAQTLSLAFYVQPENRPQLNTPDRLDRFNLRVRESGGRLFFEQETERLIAALIEMPTQSREIQSIIRLRESILFAFLLPLFMAIEYLLRHCLFVNARKASS